MGREGAVPILTIATPALPIPTYSVRDKVSIRVSDRVRKRAKLHLWLRQTQTITLFPQLQAYHNGMFVGIATVRIGTCTPSSADIHRVQ